MLDGETIFVSTIPGVASCAKAGCASLTPLAQFVTPGAGVLATDAASVYFLDGAAVRACAKPSCAGGPRTIAAGLAQVPKGIAVDEANVYFSIGGASSAPDDAGAVLVCPTSGCSGAPEVLASGLHHPVDVAVDGATVFWLDQGTSAGIYEDGDIESCAKTGCAGAPSVLAAHQPLPAALAVDDRCVYWATDGEPLGPGQGSLHRAPR